MSEQEERQQPQTLAAKMAEIAQNATETTRERLIEEDRRMLMRLIPRRIRKDILKKAKKGLREIYYDYAGSVGGPFGRYWRKRKHPEEWRRIDRRDLITDVARLLCKEDGFDCTVYDDYAHLRITW